MLNEISMDTVCGSLAYAMGIEPPAHAAAPAQPLVNYIDEKLNGGKVDRILMYNPDAIGQWITEKYPSFVKEVVENTELELPLRTVMPSVTPVCFGTMYTGAQPEVHGIQKYEKPIIRIDTLFDAMIRAGKKCVIVASDKCSLANIFLEREMDYIIAPGAETVSVAAELIREDKYDFIVVYNGNYDFRMHRAGPEGVETLAELRYNSYSFATLCQLVKKHWKNHNTLMGFAMDHGSHDTDIINAKGVRYLGTHGSDMPEDLNVVHRYIIHKEQK